MGYTKQALSGFGWLGILKVGTKGLAIAKIFILARLLTPNDFGLFGLTTAVLALVERLSETGINTFLMQKKDRYEAYFNTAWVISIVRGSLIALLLGGLAFVLPSFYHAPSLFLLLIAACFIPLIKGLINPAIIQYWKTMQYDKETLLRGFLALVEAISAIALTLVMRTVFALILALIFSAVIEVVISHVFIRPRPTLNMSLPRLREILRLSGWLNIGGLLAFLVNNLDDLIIGKLLGTTLLGYYQTTFSVAQSTVAEVGELGAQTVFPIYTRIHQDKKRMLWAYLRVLIPLSVLLLIPIAVLLTRPALFVTIALGKQWLPIVPILPWLLAAGYIQALNAVTYPLYLAIGRPQYNVSILFVHLVSMLTLLIPLASRYGLVGAGSAILLSYLIIQPLFVWLTARTLKWGDILTTKS